VAALAAACGGGSEPVRAHTAPLWNPVQPQRPAKVLIIVEENRTPRSALAGMPYLASLAASYGKTTAYKAVTHPSLPNYLAIAGGSTFGVRDDAGPASHHISGPSVFDRAIAGGRTAKTYAEAMPSPCALTSTSRYAVKHNPWAYFSDPVSRANCRTYDVPLGTTTAGALRSDVDAGTLPTVGLVIPDICNDGHDCSLATSDAWLKSWLTVVRQGPDYRAGRLAIIVTFDEDDYSADNTVQTVVVSPYSSHIVTNRAFTHYSLTRYLAEITGTTPLGAGRTAPSLRAAFQL
jgi:acid phosphatase